MNPHLCRIALRPRSALESFDLALLLLRRHARRYLDLSLVVVAPFLAMVFGAMLALPVELHPLVLALALGLAPLLHGPFTVLTGRLLFADDVTARQALGEVRGRLGGLLLAWFSQMSAAVLGVCTGVFWVVALPVTAWVFETALLERVPTQAMLTRSSSLAWRNFSIALAATVGWLMLTLWGGLVGELTGQVVVGFVLRLGEPFGSLFDLRITPYLVAGLILAQPLVATYRLLLYVDVRTRVEGWDLQVALRAAGLGAASPEEAA